MNSFEISSINHYNILLSSLNFSDFIYNKFYVGMVIIGDEILNGFTNEINMAVASKALSKCIKYNDISPNVLF